MAEAERIERGYLGRLLRLTLLAPDIVEAILDGRQPHGLGLPRLPGSVPGGLVCPARGIGARLIRVRRGLKGRLVAAKSGRERLVVPEATARPRRVVQI